MCNCLPFNIWEAQEQFLWNKDIRVVLVLLVLPVREEKSPHNSFFFLKHTRAVWCIDQLQWKEDEEEFVSSAKCSPKCAVWLHGWNAHAQSEWGARRSPGSTNLWRDAQTGCDWRLFKNMLTQITSKYWRYGMKGMSSCSASNIMMHLQTEETATKIS